MYYMRHGLNAVACYERNTVLRVCSSCSGGVGGMIRVRISGSDTNCILNTKSSLPATVTHGWIIILPVAKSIFVVRGDQRTDWVCSSSNESSSRIPPFPQYSPSVSQSVTQRRSTERKQYTKIYEYPVQVNEWGRRWYGSDALATTNILLAPFPRSVRFELNNFICPLKH